MNQASRKGSLRFRGHSRHKKYKNKLNELNASLVAVNTMDAESVGVVEEEPSVQLQHPVPWQWSVPLMASPIINYTSMTTRPSDIQVGNIFRFPQPMDPPHQRKKRGERSADKKNRAPRKCQRCVKFKGEFSSNCRGRAPNYKAEGCEYFDAEGNPKTPPGGS